MLRLRNTLPISLLALAACGGGSSSDTAPNTATATPPPAATPRMSPEAVARAFFEAVSADDKPRLGDLFTEKARASVASGDSFQVESESLGEYEVGTAVTDAGTTKVPVVAVLDGQEQDMRLLMRRESDAWRIFGFDVSIGGEGWMTFNLESIEDLVQGMVEGMATGMEGALEEAFSDWSLGGSPEEIALARQRFESLQPLSAEDHRSAWQVDVRATNRPARELLSSLVEGTGLALDTTARAKVFAQPITLELSGVSRLEAIERVAALLDLHPKYPDATRDAGAFGRVTKGMASAFEDSLVEAGAPATAASGPAIAFRPGRRPLPVAFAGPFLVEVEEIVENPPTATGSVSLVVRALGLSAACLAYQTELMELVSIDAVEGPRDQNLNADDGVSFLGTPKIADRYLVDRTHVDLLGLLRDVKEIKSLRGRISLPIPTSIVDARCTDAATETVAAQGFEISRRDWGTYTTFDVHCQADAERIEVRMSPLGEKGVPMGTLMADSMPWDDVVRASLQTPEAPTAIDFKLCTVETMTYPFEMNVVPLLRFVDNPTELTRLEFAGDAPFAVDFVRFTKRDADFPEVELKIQSRCNKDAKNVVAEFHYLDAAGKELESFQHTLTGTFGFNGLEPFAARSSQSQQTTAFFMPAETDRVRIVVTQVEFTDATSWARPE